MPGADDTGVTRHDLSDLRDRALTLETRLNEVFLGQPQAVRLLLIALFARGHALLEGDVGVGKTTLLRALARATGGAFERLEGTIDLMPNDLLYYTYINAEGRPQVDPGPLVRHGEALSFFFFNEVNRARPQVHSLLLRVMAERSVTAFNREYHFPRLQVFADRNRVEKEETFEIPSAARDRFLMEIPVEISDDDDIRRQLMFDTRFHDTDELLGSLEPAQLPVEDIHAAAPGIQDQVQAGPALECYALALWQATRDPVAAGVEVEGVEMEDLIEVGASPRGAGMLIRAARVAAWLADRDHVQPEDIQTIFHATMAHRVFLQPVYELRRARIAPALMRGILARVSAP